MSQGDARSDAGLKQFYSRAAQTKVKCGGTSQGHTQCYADPYTIAFEQDTPDQLDISHYTYIGTSKSNKTSEAMSRRQQSQKMMKDKS
jgi:hypothetical protein